jgi:hypothetical protein
VGLKVSGTHQLLAYADDMNLLGDNIDTVKRNTKNKKANSVALVRKRTITTQTLIDASKEVSLEVLLSRHQNAGQNHDIKIGNRCFENVTQFRYLGTTITT